MNTGQFSGRRNEAERVRRNDATVTVTRADLADAVHRRTGVSRAESAQFLEMFLEEIFASIVAREDVKLSSFGAFIVRAKRERVGRNPKTGAGAKISARLVVTFKPSNILRARINNCELAAIGNNEEPPGRERRRASAQNS
ncbi:MAG: integration host factor subunit alpha [Methylocystis sp.]|nr:integration host factor subunit alpha [Methylocystis sp.]